MGGTGEMRDMSGAAVGIGAVGDTGVATTFKFLKHALFTELSPRIS